MKPELFEDDKTGALPLLEFKLFVGLITQADDFGNGRATAGYLRGALFWGNDEVTPGNVDAALERLALDGLIELYSDGTQRYFHIKGWSKHQKVDHPGKPRVPVHSREPREIVARTSETLALEQSREGSGPGDDQEPSRAPAALLESDVWIANMEARIRVHPIFASVDALRRSKEHAGRMISKPQKLDWVLDAIDEAAAKSSTAEQAHVLLGRLVSFMNAAKAPKSGPVPVEPKRYAEFKRDNIKPIDAAQQGELAAKIAGIGRGAA